LRTTEKHRIKLWGIRPNWSNKSYKLSLFMLFMVLKVEKFAFYVINKLKGIRKDLICVPFIASKPKGANIVVLSPHFDDEIFGCGGTLRKHILTGDRVNVIYMTDGRYGVPDIKNKSYAEKIRKKESAEALKVLGIRYFYYLDEPECTRQLNDATVKKLVKILDEIKPDLIYLPWFLENHIDHIKINKLLYFASKSFKFKFDICAYEVWTPLIPNLIVDITSVIEEKKMAMKCFKSQLHYVNYCDIVLGLNKYRTCSNMKGRGFAEAFLHTSSDFYFGLFNKNDY